jgi:hypothetical protein
MGTGRANHGREVFSRANQTRRLRHLQALGHSPFVSTEDGRRRPNTRVRRKWGTVDAWQFEDGEVAQVDTCV